MIKKAGYGNMDWVNALKAMDKPKADPQDEAACIANALESTARAAFDLPAKAETKNEAVIRSSKEIADKAAAEAKVAAANEIKSKIASNGIDPIAMGITVREPNGVQRPITKEEWEGASDARWVEKIATAAALEYEKRTKHAWEENSKQPAPRLSSKFDPAMRDGRIMSSTAANEETCDRPHQMPANSASIFDPFKLDNFAKAENAHDQAILSKRTADQQRKEELKAQYKPTEDGPDPMKHGQVIRSGGEDRDVFSQRVPSNQISMLDLEGTEKLSPEDIKTRLSDLFVSKIEDNGQKIKEANKERKEAIQGRKEADRSWEQVQKPLSTSELTKKLMDAFSCPKPPDGQ